MLNTEICVVNKSELCLTVTYRSLYIHVYAATETARERERERLPVFSSRSLSSRENYCEVMNDDNDVAAVVFFFLEKID
jgi:hypothetical protein